jgi:hypothetical protein
MADKGVYVANTSFASSFPTGEKDEKGELILDEHGQPMTTTSSVLVGKRYGGNHPLVKLAPNYFDAEGVASPVIESATAAPGEVRGA